MSRNRKIVQLMHAGAAMPTRPMAISDWDEWIEVETQKIYGANRFVGSSRSVGFLVAAFMQVGGVESWHRAIIPRIRSHRVAGVVVVGGTDYNAATWPLPCRFGVGTGEALKLCQAVDAVVVWGLADLPALWGAWRPRRAIAINHGDTRSTWSTSVATAQKPHVDALLCVHSEVAELLGGNLIPNPVDPWRVFGGIEDVRAAAGVPREAKVVFWNHRLSGEKWPRLAAKIGQALPAGWVLVMAGAGPLEAETRRLAGGKVYYVGAVDRPASWLATASVFLSTADQEGFGLAVGEAMLAGVPVVSSPYGLAAEPGLCRVVDHAGPLSTVEPWVQAIIGAGGDTVRARRLMETRYAPDRVVQELEGYLA